MNNYNLVEYPALGFAVSFAIASQYYNILHNGLTLMVLTLTVIWLGVQIWSKVKITQIELKNSSSKRSAKSKNS